MNLTTPFNVQKLQTALHAKAKGSPNFRFHALYDRVYRKVSERCSGLCLRTLQRQRRSRGSGQPTFENIEAYGRERRLDELTQELKSRT